MAGLRAIDVSVDAAEFHDLLGKTSQVSKKLRGQLRKEIKQAVVATILPEARRRIGLSPARNDVGLRQGIMSSIRVTLATSTNSGRVGVFLVTDGRNVPAKVTKAGTVTGDPAARQRLAIIFEQGQSKRPSGLKFRHPVFGNPRTRWVEQSRTPYMQVSIDAQQDTIEKAVRGALRTALESLPCEVDL